MSSLKKRAFHGVFWSISERFGNQLTGLVSSIIIARLLSPKEFGLVGIVLALISFFRIFIDFGLRDALIQKKDADNIDYSIVFLFNLVVSVILYLLLFFFSPYIASFYNEPQLENIVKILGLNLIILAISLVQTTRLTKSIEFKSQFYINFVSSVAGLIVGILLALQDYGVWAIVFQNITNNVVTACLFWIVNPWMPAISLKWDRAKQLLGFGSNLFLSGLLYSVYNNVFSLLIGKYNSATDLGLYTKARSLSEQQIGVICSAVQRVSYPVFSKLQSDNERLRIGYKKIMASLLLIVIPFSILGLVFAKSIIHELLTDKWIELTPYFQIFCLTGLLYPFHTINLNIIKVKGESGLFLRLEIIKLVLSTLIFLGTFTFGLWTIVLGQLFGSFLALYLNTFFSGRLINYPLILQLKDIKKLLFAGLALGLFSYPISLANSYIDGGLIALIFGVLASAVFYLLFCLILRISLFSELWMLVNKNLKK